MRHRVVHRHLPGGTHRHRDQVGALARLERADQRLHTERLRAVDGGHVQRHLRRHRGGIARRQLREERRLTHRLEHVEVVVARGTVGAECQVHAGRQILQHRCGAAGQLHIALWVMRDADIVLLQDRDVVVGHPDAVGGHRLRSPEAERLEVAGGRVLVFVARRLHLVLRFRQVDEDRHVVLAAECRRGLQRGGIERVHRVRRHGGDDQRVVLELLDEGFGTRQPLGRRLRIGHRELDDRLAEDTAQARFLRGLRDLVLEVIHVGVGRGARLDHLQRSQPRPRADEVRRHRLRLGREDVLLQPVHQREVVGEATEHHHRRVGVGIDQAGQDDLVARIDRLRGVVARRDLGGGADVDDVEAVDGDGAGREHLARIVLGEDRAADDHERHRAARALCRGDDRRGHECEDDRERCAHTGDIV